MPFEVALSYLRQGYAIKRKDWTSICVVQDGDCLSLKRDESYINTLHYMESKDILVQDWVIAE